ncbi:MAG: cytochrome c biogenesis protein CcsA [Spirochaetales bacterium]|nr:cytochrome c biogenesis protein CcsA [Spirochaetales bacterium]
MAAKRSVFLDALSLLALLGVVGANFLGLYYPDVITQQGVAHRIFYLHVPLAWVALYAPLLAALSGILYLVRRRAVFDIISLSATRISLVFSITVVISGALWARVEWGTYWNPLDSRLNSFLVLFLILVGYFLLRGMIDAEERRATVGALIAIFSALASVLTWFAIRLVEPDTHPQSVLGSMAPDIRFTFWMGVLAYHLFFFALLYRLYLHEIITRKLRSDL